MMEDMLKEKANIKLNLVHLAMIAVVALGISLFAISAYAATYYVDGASGDDNNAGTIESPWKTIHKANITLQAGDTVYIRGGDYNLGSTNTGGTDSKWIQPENTGTEGKPITYQSYPGEQVHFIGLDEADYPRGIYIKDKSYIRVIGDPDYLIKFSNTYYMLQILGSDHCEIAYCDFNTVKSDIDLLYATGACREHSSHNWIHHNNFEKIGRFVETQESPRIVAHQGIGLEVGTDRNNPSYGQDHSDYNTIEYNTFFGGGHHCLGVNSRFNIVRHNNLQNAPWFDMGDGELAGYRPLFMQGQAAYSGHNVLENNRIHHATANLTENNAGGTNLSLCSPYNIIRYNEFYRSDGLQMYFHPYTEDVFRSKPIYNHVYNNTFFHGCFGTDPDLGTVTWRYAILLLVWPDEIVAPDTGYDWVKGNVFKNNLFDSNYNQIELNNTSIVRNWSSETGHGTVPLYQTIENNQDDYAPPFVDPLFVNTDISDPRSALCPDLSLQSGSPMINQGTYLTQAVGLGNNSTILLVNDASYFQDGTWGSDLSTIDADWIAIGTIDNTAQIASIDYSENKITLDCLMTWSDGAPVWLYNNSSGERVLYGDAPDMGAHEYIEEEIAGDVNLDSFVNITDIQACVNHILGTQSYATADVNVDSSENVLDVQAIVNIILSG